MKKQNDMDSDKKIRGLQDQISKLEDVILKKKSKAKKIKTITVSSDVHSCIKKFCAKKGIKIGEWVEEILTREISDQK
jgi:hypothetical protein